MIMVIFSLHLATTYSLTHHCICHAGVICFLLLFLLNNTGISKFMGFSLSSMEVVNDSLIATDLHTLW